MEKRQVKFGDIKIGPIAQMHLDDVIKNNWPSGGEKVKLFESQLAELFEVNHAVAVSSGTDAVMCACMAIYDYGAKPGDYIIVPALSFIATSNAVRAAGFTPLFVDIDLFTMNIDYNKIESAIIYQRNRDVTKKVVGIIGVTTMGKPIRGNILQNIANNNNIKLIIDNAEGHGCRWNGQLMESYGDMVTYSFYAAHMICAGEGGAITTKDEKLKDILMSVRSHGRRSGLYFDHCRFGLNSKMNDLEASIGLEGVGNFWDTFNRRKEILEMFVDKSAKLQNYVYVNTENSYEIVAPHAFSMVIKEPELYNRDNFYTYLMSQGIDTKINFGCIPTQHDTFKYLGYENGQFPIAEFVGDNGVHVGCHQYMTEEDVDYIIYHAMQFFEGE